MESAILTTAKKIRTYGRRLPKPQHLPVTHFDNVLLALPASSSAVGPVEYEIAKRNQYLAVHSHSPKLEGSQTEPSPVFHNFPRRQRSTWRYLQKRMRKVVDSGDQKEGNMQELPSEALQNPHCCATTVCRRQRGSLHGNNSKRRGTRKRKGNADHSSDSEKYAPRLHRGPRRRPLHCSNSITQQGVLDSKTFECYLESIWSRIAQEKRNSFAYLDSLWFSLYTKSCYKEKVLNWIKRKDIFSKKYVLVPIVMWSHWSLLILCQFGEESKVGSPCMVLLDSLQSANQNLEPLIRNFVLDIHKMEERPANRESVRKIPLLVPKVPQQRNGEECGYYVLFYVNLFIGNAPERFSISEGYPYFMKGDWFTVESLANFRHRLDSVPVEASSYSDE